ncbi:MAG: hypothetical protein ACTHKG_13565, partial [Nocardioides sp.]
MRENKGRWSVTFTGVALLLTTLILGFATTTSPAEAQDNSSYRYAAGSRPTARWAGSIDTRSRSAVNAAYWSQYAPKLTLNIDWLLGSVLGCQPGVTGSSTNAATLSSLNFVRSLAGLGPVSFSPALNASAQQAALI